MSNALTLSDMSPGLVKVVGREAPTSHLGGRAVSARISGQNAHAMSPIRAEYPAAAYQSPIPAVGYADRPTRAKNIALCVAALPPSTVWVVSWRTKRFPAAVARLPQG